MKLIDGKIFDRVRAEVMIDYLKNLNVQIIETDPRSVKVIKTDNDILK